MSRVLVFSGPTLNEEQIHEIAPHVEVHPPVAAGDLLRLSLEPGDLVAIIDGYYFQAASVRHKEILDLLARGVHVWGAASMGALRGAELAPFGMRGFGDVFQAYVNGEIDGDDEVAVMHAPQEMDYIKLTEALVNIRYACQAAVTEELLSVQEYRNIMEVASELPFFERSYANIFKQASERGIAPQVIEQLQPFVSQPRLDLKKSDALELVQALNTLPSSPFQPEFEFYETRLLRNWRQDEQGMWVKGQWITYRDLLTAYQLFGEDYPAVHYQVLSQQLVNIARNALHERKMPDAAVIPQFFSTQYGFRLDQELPPTARRWLRSDEQALALAEQLLLLGVRLWHVQQGESWQATMIQHIKASSLFPILLKIVYQAHQYQRALENQQRGVYLERLLPEKMSDWFMRRWQISEADFDYAILDRGFSSQADFWQAARSFYLFDKYVGVSKPSGLLKPVA